MSGMVTRPVIPSAAMSGLRFAGSASRAIEIVSPVPVPVPVPVPETDDSPPPPSPEQPPRQSNAAASTALQREPVVRVRDRAP